MNPSRTGPGPNALRRRDFLRLTVGADAALLATAACGARGGAGGGDKSLHLVCEGTASRSRTRCASAGRFG